MGNQWGSGALYVHRHASVFWPNYSPRSADDLETLYGGARLWDAVYAARGDDPPPPPKQPEAHWPDVAEQRCMVWNGGQADGP